MSYTANDIKSLSFREGVRARVQMYLGSDDIEGTYQSFKEILNNSTDEAIAGYGDKIEIEVSEKENLISVRDYGRGVPFLVREDGSNVLVDIYTKSHTGGKFDNNVYKNSSGLNGIGGSCVCLSSEYFIVQSFRDGQSAIAEFKKGELISYYEKETKEKNGTFVSFIPDKEVFKNGEIGYSYKRICEDIKNISYLYKGIIFSVKNLDTKEERSYSAKNGIIDFVKDNVKDPIQPNIIYKKVSDSTDTLEIAFQWGSKHENGYVFVNGLMCPEGGSPITGARSAITRTFNSLAKKEFSGEMIRENLFYVINCSVANPSFANQTKTKINNANLRTLASNAFSEALKDMNNNYQADFNKIKELLTRVEKAEAAAARARTAVMDAQKTVEKELKKKSVLAGKLVDCEKHNEESQLLIVEGKSALGSIVNARDGVTTACFPLRGKIINVLKNNEEDIFNNQEVKELQIALGCGIGDKFNMKKLRYGRICIAADLDYDGYAIVCLVLTFFYKYYPELIRQGKIYWARTPLFSVETKGQTYYAYTEEELVKLPKGKVSRNKGLGEISAEEMKRTLFDNQDGYVQFTMEDATVAAYYFNLLLGENVKGRREYIFENIDFDAVEE
nr:MAG TPA: DNA TOPOISOMERASE IV, B SUBUNIT [Caudoviricetes sp.]